MAIAVTCLARMRMREPMSPNRSRKRHRRQRVVLMSIERDMFRLLRLPRGQWAAEWYPTHTVTSPHAEAQRFHPIKGRRFKSDPHNHERRGVSGRMSR